MKKCSKCDIEKSYDEFSRDKRRPNGRQTWCRSCLKEYRINNKEEMARKRREYYLNNKEKIIKNSQEYYINNKERITQYKKKHSLQNKEKIAQQQKEYSLNNKEKLKKYRLNNREKFIRYNKEYQISNREKIARRKKEYYLNNKERIVEYIRKHTNKRRAFDVQFRLKEYLRGRLNKVLRSNYKSGSAVRDLGCSIPELKQYLESKFKPGMSWENHGRYGWHIDHIIPLSSFDLTDRDQFLKACHYTNLQPLWAKDNLSKSDKILV